MFAFAFVRELKESVVFPERSNVAGYRKYPSRALASIRQEICKRKSFSHTLNGTRQLVQVLRAIPISRFFYTDPDQLRQTGRWQSGFS